jgi:hypothetical protein
MVDKLEKLLEKCPKVAVAFNHKFPETRLCQLQKLLPAFGTTFWEVKLLKFDTCN